MRSEARRHGLEWRGDEWCIVAEWCDLAWRRVMECYVLPPRGEVLWGVLTSSSGMGGVVLA